VVVVAAVVVVVVRAAGSGTVEDGNSRMPRAGRPLRWG